MLGFDVVLVVTIVVVVVAAVVVVVVAVVVESNRVVVRGRVFVVLDDGYRSVRKRFLEANYRSFNKEILDFRVVVVVDIIVVMGLFSVVMGLFSVVMVTKSLRTRAVTGRSESLLFQVPSHLGSLYKISNMIVSMIVLKFIARLHRDFVHTWSGNIVDDPTAYWMPVNRVAVAIRRSDWDFHVQILVLVSI